MKKFLFKILVLAGIGHYAVKLFPKMREYAREQYAHLLVPPFEGTTHAIRSRAQEAKHNHSHSMHRKSSVPTLKP